MFTARRLDVFYYNPYWIEEICGTPAEILASRAPQALVSRRLGRQSAERERISRITERFFGITK
ncbi:hypothetical protein P4576_00115 [Peribacillus frigoritolerans]|uniref:hypothetical protein n=1 Tax=Peribacillus frigoritolerans TaxID=450367 RepID=UPI002E20E4D2|nr:hypothetical protein [Peribacillus frigoritolerans]